MENKDLETLEANNELVVVDNGEAKIAQLLAYQLAMAEKKIKEIKQFQDDYKAKILTAMEEYGVIKIDNDGVRINYFPADVSTTFDTTAFKKDHPELYEQYLKITDKKSYIKIACK